MTYIFTPSSNLIDNNALISSDALVSSISPLSPFTPPLTVNLQYSKPLISVYDSIDHSPAMIKLMTKHYYYKVLDKWLLDELSDILGYFTMENGKIKLIKDINNYDKSSIKKDTNQSVQQKINYIQKKFFSKYDMMNLLDKFTKETGIKWSDLPKNEYLLRYAVKKYLIKKIKKAIEFEKQ